MGKLRLTMAQALVKFLDNQYLEVDGEEHKFVKGIFAIFGHGNVLGLGQALEQDSGEMRVYQGRNEQGMAHAPPVLPASPCAGRLSPAPPPSVRARPI
jgi:3D-(3,5/4)-trihydroxycyclohexane-1,2-dione acylhydrolase (decyclizing)